MSDDAGKGNSAHRRIRWINPLIDECKAAALGQRLGLSPVSASLLWARGIRDIQSAEAFLNPRLSALDDPFAITQMANAVDRIQEAMASGQSILVYGDYDVDGVTSTALLIHVLSQFGAKPRFFVPHRLDEGYGLSIEALDRAFQEIGVPDLLIAVDCGTGSQDSVRHIRQQGVDVVILDHHTSKGSLPEDCILVNPHVHDNEDAAWHNLSAVGLVFKFVHGLLKRLRADGDELAHELQLKEYLDLVALGTICDLVPLTGENRILAMHGLRLIQNGKRLGICALMQAAGWRPGDEISPVDISFRLGPRINACGRLSDATMPINLLLSTDGSFARESAQMLDAYNSERQDIERKIARQAMRMVEEHFADDPGLVLYDPEWHSGVVGIVASRVTQRYHRPTLVLGREGEEVKGSGRSVEGVDLVQVLQGCSHLFEKWGGHPMAVGCSMKESNVEPLRRSFREELGIAHQSGMPEKAVRIDCWLTTEQLNEVLLLDLEKMEPFGQKNPEPVFAMKDVSLLGCAPFGNGHLKFQVAGANGRNHAGVAWNQAESILSNPEFHQPVDIAFRFHWNHWNGRKTPRLTLLNWRKSETSEFAR